jgi:hypothetical protein
VTVEVTIQGAAPCPQARPGLKPDSGSSTNGGAQAASRNALQDGFAMLLHLREERWASGMMTRRQLHRCGSCQAKRCIFLDFGPILNLGPQKVAHDPGASIEHLRLVNRQRKISGKEEKERSENFLTRGCFFTAALVFGFIFLTTRHLMPKSWAYSLTTAYDPSSTAPALRAARD